MRVRCYNHRYFRFFCSLWSPNGSKALLACLFFRADVASGINEPACSTRSGCSLIPTCLFFDFFSFFGKFWSFPLVHRRCTCRYLIFFLFYAVFVLFFSLQTIGRRERIIARYGFSGMYWWCPLCPLLEGGVRVDIAKYSRVLREVLM